MKHKLEKYSIGLDPGFGETGMFLGKDVGNDIRMLDYASFRCPKKSVPDLARAVSLAGAVVNRILGWIDDYGIEALDISIELPIYNGDAQTLIKQARLLEEIESAIFYMVAGQLRECWLTEVNPSTSKFLVNCPPNRKPVPESPFADSQEMEVPTQEALADAWAHSQAT